MSREVEAKVIRTWKFISDDEAMEMMAAGPATVDVSISGRDLAEAERGIFKVASPGGNLKTSTGNEVFVKEGEPLKLLPENCKPKDWVYEVVEVPVQVAGGGRATLRSGVKVAVLPPNYVGIMERRNDARDDERRAGS